MDRFEQFKSKFPEFSNLSNGEIVNLVSQYTGADPQRVYSEFGGEQNRSAFGDLGTALKIGAQRLPETATGLADVLVAPITGRASVSEAADSLGRATGFRPGQWANDSQLNYSPAQQQFLQQGAQTEGFADTAAHYLTNPMRSVVQGVESVPSMALGGVYARGLRGLGGLGNAARFGAGEGGVMAGQAMNQMVDDGVDPARAAGYAAGVGALGGALGYGGGRLAERLGVVNPDALFGGGGRTVLAEGATAPGVLRRVGGGMLSEGAFEEMPQSAMEAAMGNLAAERPWDQDVGKQAAAGLVLGGLMGGVVGVVPPARNPADPIDILNRDTSPQPEAAPQVGQSELNFDITGEEAIGTRGLRNPFDAAGYVSGFQQGQETTVDVPQSDLFGGVNEMPPVDVPRAPKIDIPVPQPLQNDPVRSAVAQASPATLRKDGSLKDIVEKALGAYSEFSDGEIAAALEEFAASKRKDTVWRVAALEAIARQRAAQGVQPANVPPTQQVAPQAQEARGQESAQVGTEQSRDAERAQVSRIFDALSEREREVLTKYHFDKMTFAAIGNELKERGEKGVTRQRIEQIHKTALGKILGAGQPFGLTEDRLRLYFPDESVRLAGGADVQTASAAEVAQAGAGMHYRNESDNGAVNRANDEGDAPAFDAQGDRAVDGVGFDTDPETGDGFGFDTEVANAEFDEGFQGEVGADIDVLESVDAVETLARTERDHAGREITEEAVRIAGLDYDQDLQEGDVPFAQLDRADQIRYTKAAIAFNDEVLSAQQLMRVFGEIADGARQQASQPQRAVEEAGAVAQVQGAVPTRDAREARQEADTREEVTSTADSRTAGLGDGTGTQAQYLTEDRSEFRGTVDGLHGASTPVLNVTDPSEVPPRLRNDAGAWSDGESDGFYFAEPEDRSWFRGSKIRMPDFRYAYEVNVRFNRAFLLTPQTLERFVEKFGTDPMGAVRAMREQGFDGVVTRGFDTDWQAMDALVEQYGLEGGAMSWGPMLMDQAVSFDPAKNVRITGRDGKLTEAIRRVTTAESRLRLLANRAGIDLDAARVANARYNENVGTPNEEYYASQPGAAEAIRFFARDDVSAAVAEVERANNAVLELAEQPRGEPRFSRTSNTQGTTVEAVRSAINDIATPMGRRKVTVYQTADEAVQNGTLNSKDAKGTQGWVDSKGNAFFIAGNIPNGSELAVVLHEIGAHLGIEKLLTDKQYEALVKKIFAWAQSDANTQEAKIARAALARVDAAKLENEADLAPETIAYFIEEAVKAGVNPTAMQYKTELERWFRTLWAAFKVALRRLNLINADRLTAQNVVDLAYGAANLELTGVLDATYAGGYAGGSSRLLRPEGLEGRGRRRITRYQGGRVPNIVFTRETGAAVGKRGFVPSDVVAKRFSKLNTSTPEGFFDAIRNRTADFFINPVGFMKEHGLGWLTLEQLADVVKSKAVTNYHRVMVAMQQFSKDRVHDAALIDVEWAKLSPNEQRRLSTVMRGATRASYDPENETPTNDEQRTLNDQYEALTPAAKDIYLKVREYYSTNFEARKQILLDAANRAKAAGKNTSEVERMFAKVKGPYFPLMRIGGWYSVGVSPELADLMDKKERNEASAAELKRIETLRKDAKHYVSRGHTTRRDAELSRRELQAQLGVAYANRAEERIGQEVAQLPDMAKLEEYIAPHLPVGVRSQVRDMLAQAYFDALPEKSALKRQLKREGVHGEEEDMRRVFAASALSSAHHISRLKYANDLSEAMVKVRAEGRRDETLRMVGNELNKRTALALDMQENPIVDRVLQVSYFANLGLSPAFLLTNMTQVPMITAPWLGARHGFAKATRALAEAFTDTKDMVRATYAGKGVKDGWRSEFDWSQKYPEGTDEHKLFRALLDRNLLDITMEHDLTAVAEVRNTKIDDAIKIANLPVRVTETVNRSITGLAAYRLARADGKSHEQAVEHAAKALSETQLNYSGLNTARHMQVVLGSKALARLMMQFRKFQQGMVYLIVKNAYDAYKGETKEDRRIARRTLAGVFGTTGLMAGTLGLPFAGTVATVVGAVGGMLDDDDEPFDPVVEYRNFLTDMFGPEMAAVLAKGLPTLMNVDLSKRVGMGDIGTPLPFMRQGRTGTEAVNNTLGAAAGAWAGTTASMLDGIAFLANGDYAKAAEKIIPIKAAQNLVRGYRYDDQGLTNRNGELVVPAEKFSAWDIALRTAGFQPMREAEYYEANQAVEGAKRAAQDTRTKLLRQYAQAKLRGEPTADVDAEIKAFNERHPQKGLRIDYSARARAVQARRKMADERNEAGVRVDRTGALFEERGRFAAP